MEMFQGKGAVCVEMEGACIAAVCEYKKLNSKQNKETEKEANKDKKDNYTFFAFFYYLFLFLFTKKFASVSFRRRTFFLELWKF